MLEIRAYHEAGHAVVAILRGFDVAVVTIARRGRTGGACAYRFTVPSPGRAGAVRRMARAGVAVALAGSVAQDRFALERGYVALDPRTGAPFPLFAAGAEDDEHVAMGFAGRLLRSRAGRRAFLRRMRGSTERLLGRPEAWAAVGELARSLLRRRTLSGASVAVGVARAIARS
jgi:hypothetical protein